MGPWMTGPTEMASLVALSLLKKDNREARLASFAVVVASLLDVSSLPLLNHPRASTLALAFLYRDLTPDASADAFLLEERPPVFDRDCISTTRADGTGSGVSTLAFRHAGGLGALKGSLSTAT